LHGEADISSLYNSKLIFKKNQYASDDGKLYMYELLNLKLKARIAVLSACESGTGRLTTGEGVYSIARGFAAAGCPAILMTLWKVNDASTAGIVASFYRELDGGADIGVAARNAKIKFILDADHRMAHPGQWAAFLPVGEVKVVKGEPNWLTAMVVLIGIMTLGVLLIVRITRRHYQASRRNS
jgi:CHAT domain-containing protein